MLLRVNIVSQYIILHFNSIKKSTFLKIINILHPYLTAEAESLMHHHTSKHTLMLNVLYRKAAASPSIVHTFWTPCSS